MAGLYDSTENFNLNAVSVPVTGIAAFNPIVTSAGVVPDQDMGSKTLDLGALKYRRLGLYKQDGGVEEGSNSFRRVRSSRARPSGRSRSAWPRTIRTSIASPRARRRTRMA